MTSPSLAPPIGDGPRSARWHARLGQMGGGLSVRLTLAMVVLVVVAALALGWLVQRQLEAALMPIELGRLTTDVRALSARLEAHVGDVRNSVRAIAASPDVHAFVADRGDDDVRARIERDFAAHMRAQPSFIQLRIIGRADDGRERIRVERVGEDLRVVSDRTLQHKGDRDYVRETLTLPASAIHVSPIELNRERGVVQEPHIPVLRVATAIADGEGATVAILVVNIDLRAVFAEVRAATAPDTEIHLVNARGDYLVHRDRAREFGFDLGRPDRIQTDYPAIEPLLENLTPGGEVMRDAEGRQIAVAVAPVQMASGPRLSVVETVARPILLASATPVREASIVAALMAVLAAFVLAAVLARSLTRPIAAMAAAVEGFPSAEPPPLPVRAGGEIGALARAFARMDHEIRERTKALQHEIEEHRRTEVALERNIQAQRIYASVIDVLPDAIMIGAADGTFTDCNPAAERLFGYTRAEFTGRTNRMIVPDDRLDEVDTVLARVRQGERILGLETERVHKDGRRISVSLSIAPIVGPSGEVRTTAAVVRDLTERKLAEEKFHLALEACPSGVIMIDGDGAIILANAELERMFGYRRAEIMGRSIEILVPEDRRDSHVAHRSAFSAAPEARAMGAGRDLHGRRKDGTTFPVEIGLRPVPTSTGVVVLAMVVDISERQRFIQDLEQRSNELQRSNADLEQFAYVASHDLREPLRMVASYTELLAERYQGRLDEKADKYIAYAVDGAKRMQQLVNDLLAFSRVGTQAQPRRPTEVARTVRRCLELYRATLEEMGAELVVGDLPLLAADESQLAQLFQNLIGNAIKFRSERTLRLEIGARRGEREWTLFVADNGIGIEPAYSERIFQMFQRLHERGRYEGSGIGLAIAKKIVERHGGRIWFESNEGTTFFFTIPDERKGTLE